MSEKTSYYLSIVTFPESKILIEEGIMELLIVPLLHDDRIIGALNLATRDRIKLTESEKMIFESIGTRIAQMIALIMIQDKLTIRNEELQTTLRDKQEKQQLLIQKSKLESLGEMAAGVAHEINQPLGVILLSLENVLFKISAKKASRQYLDDKFTSIFNNIGKIKTIIDHIRTFSHDQKSIIIERINVNEVIRSACSLINEQYGYHNISLNFNLDEDIGYALGNNQKMEQVIFNLLSNSKFALEEKDATTMAVPFEKEISIRTYSDDKKIYIDVKDNGTGIDKDDLLNIFNPFFTTKPVGVGTGLGLSIVYGIITEMKGLITIESERNEFTLVHVELLRYTVKT
jgi:C4-dicarboxylate-specific signal transduction histidine kinase